MRYKWPQALHFNLIRQRGVRVRSLWLSGAACVDALALPSTALLSRCSANRDHTRQARATAIMAQAGRRWRQHHRSFPSLPRQSGSFQFAFPSYQRITQAGICILPLCFPLLSIALQHGQYYHIYGHTAPQRMHGRMRILLLFSLSIIATATRYAAGARAYGAIIFLSPLSAGPRAHTRAARDMHRLYALISLPLSLSANHAGRPRGRYCVTPRTSSSSALFNSPRYDIRAHWHYTYAA